MIPKYSYHEPVIFKEKFPVSLTKYGPANIFVPQWTRGRALFYDKRGTEERQEDDMVQIEISICPTKPELVKKVAWIKFGDFEKLKDTYLK